MTQIRILLLLLIASALIAACDNTTTSDNQTIDDTTSDTTADATPTIEVDEGIDADADVNADVSNPDTDVDADADADIDNQSGAVDSSSVAYNGPAWSTISMVNAASGETFTLADLAGKNGLHRADGNLVHQLSQPAEYRAWCA